MKRFILQAVNEEDHLEAVREVLGLAELQSATISTAFMTASGLSLLQDALVPIAAQLRIFVGIRNGVTTVQSIEKALEIGCKTYLVDTSSRQRIFHPKMYYARSADCAKLLLGSANLTMGGLLANIEASVLQELDLAVDAEFIADMEGKLDAMISDYPDHVTRAVDIAQLAELQRAGRLWDERQNREPSPAGISTDRMLDVVPRMILRTAFPRTADSIGSPAILANSSQLVQVWESRGLTRRDLNIPVRGSTNPTGSMLLGVGAWEGIDQQRHFRHEVFKALGWTPDADALTAHIERAEAHMRLIVKHVDYGAYEMQLSHNMRTDTATYAQGNSMTSLHWGTAKHVVAREDLLDRVLKLFRGRDDLTRFVLEID